MNHKAKSVAVQDWGLPNWRDKSKYPDHGRVTLLGFCWQFVRRSPAYREFWQQKVYPRQQAHLVASIKDYGEACNFLTALGERRSPVQVMLDGPLLKSDKSAQFRVIDGGHAYGMQEATRRFGLMRAYDPRHSVCGASFKLDGATVCNGGNRNPGTLDKDEILMSFNLNLPIQPQVERAKVVLTHKQLSRDLPTEVRQPLPSESFQDFQRRLARAIADSEGARPRRELRAHPEKFASYLRVLDAKEAGASNIEIAAVLFPKLHKENAVQSVINHYNAACRIRDKDYRLYVALADEGRS